MIKMWCRKDHDDSIGCNGELCFPGGWGKFLFAPLFYTKTVRDRYLPKKTVQGSLNVHGT